MTHSFFFFLLFLSHINWNYYITLQNRVKKHSRNTCSLRRIWRISRTALEWLIESSKLMALNFLNVHILICEPGCGREREAKIRVITWGEPHTLCREILHCPAVTCGTTEQSLLSLTCKSLPGFIVVRNISYYSRVQLFIVLKILYIQMASRTAFTWEGISVWPSILGFLLFWVLM